MMDAASVRNLLANPEEARVEGARIENGSLDVMLAGHRRLRFTRFLYAYTRYRATGRSRSEAIEFAWKVTA